jgi:hypothetical protein
MIEIYIRLSHFFFAFCRLFDVVDIVELFVEKVIEDSGNELQMCVVNVSLVGWLKYWADIAPELEGWIRKILLQVAFDLFELVGLLSSFEEFLEVIMLLELNEDGVTSFEFFWKMIWYFYLDVFKFRWLKC